MSSPNIAQLFNKFAGREVAVKETVSSVIVAGQMYTFTEAELATPKDQTMVEMEKVAKDSGLMLRVVLPNQMVTMDYRPDRVTVSVEKDFDGKYRVGNKFKLG